MLCGFFSVATRFSGCRTAVPAVFLGHKNVAEQPYGASGGAERAFPRCGTVPFTLPQRLFGVAIKPVWQDGRAFSGLRNGLFRAEKESGWEDDYV